MMSALTATLDTKEPFIFLGTEWVRPTISV